MLENFQYDSTCTLTVNLMHRLNGKYLTSKHHCLHNNLNGSDTSECKYITSVSRHQGRAYPYIALHVVENEAGKLGRLVRW